MSVSMNKAILELSNTHLFLHNSCDRDSMCSPSPNSFPSGLFEKWPTDPSHKGWLYHDSLHSLVDILHSDYNPPPGFAHLTLTAPLICIL